MTPRFHALMSEATRLTRAADLGAAVAAIQRALATSARDDSSHPQAETGVVPATQSQSSTHPQVIDVEARILASDASVDAAVLQPESPAGAPTEQGDPSAPADIGAPRAGQQWLAGQFAHEGRAIDYRLFVPAQVDPHAKPALVVMLHGCTQDAEDFARGTQMNALARREGVLVLYPQQSQRANPQRCWNWFKTQHQARERGEPGLLVALTRSVIQAHGIDEERVYVAGLSAGGAMADILGRTYPDVFAAIGVHSGLPWGAAGDLGSAMSAMRVGGKSRQNGTPVLPTIVFHGDADATVHPLNGHAIVDAALRSSAPPSAIPETTHGTSARGRSYSRNRYASATGAVTIEHWVLHGSGHAWSGGSAQGSYTDATGVSASAEMLRFFLTHRHAPVPSSTVAA